MQKIRKILRPVSEKTALPTNQPTNQPIITNSTDIIGPRWRQSNKRNDKRFNNRGYSLFFLMNIF